MELSGKTVVLVGGFGGIGMAISKHLLQKNLKHLIILDKDDNATAMAELKTLSTDCTAVHFYKFDATWDKLSMQVVLDKILKVVENIDVFIYGAGICNDHLHELTLQVNLAGLINAIAVVLPHMDKRTGGRGGMIVSLSSLSGLDPVSFVPIYSATKAAMISITRSLSHDLIYAQTNVSFIVICPGTTKTAILGNVQTFLNLEKNLDIAAKDVPFQSADVCGKNLVAAIERGENGAIWVLDMGEMQRVVPVQYWQKPAVLE